MKEGEERSGGAEGESESGDKCRVENLAAKPADPLAPDNDDDSTSARAGAEPVENPEFANVWVFGQLIPRPKRSKFSCAKIQTRPNLGFSKRCGGERPRERERVVVALGHGAL